MAEICKLLTFQGLGPEAWLQRVIGLVIVKKCSRMNLDLVENFQKGCDCRTVRVESEVGKLSLDGRPEVGLLGNRLV